MSVKWIPKPYMLKAVKWLVQHGSAGLWLDPGLGKTSINYVAMKTLIDVGETRGRPFLVTAPLRPCYLVWPAEQQKWTQLAALRVVVLHGKDKDKHLDVLLEARRKNKPAPADVYVINPDGYQWLFYRLARHATIDRWPFHGLSIDESTLFKNSTTLRFKLLKAHLHLFHRRWINTGTPAPKGLLDLFGQIYILDLGGALGRYITHYRRAYFAPTGYGGYTWVPQTGAADKIYRKLEPLILRMDEKDHLKLPPIVGNFGNPDHPPNLWKVKLPPKARQTYDHLEELFFAELKSGSITAANAGVKTMKLAQAANGGVYYDKGGDEDADDVRTKGQARRWALIHEEKTDAAAELLGELGGKQALIVYDFHHDLERLRRHPELKRIPNMGGGNTPKEDAALEKAWNADELPALFVNAQSIAHGLNLQEGGRAIIWHSITWNWEHYWQLIKRLWRQGRLHSTFVYHLVAMDTIDEVKCDTLAGKGQTERALLDALRRYSMRRPTRAR